MAIPKFEKFLYWFHKNGKMLDGKILQAMPAV